MMRLVADNTNTNSQAAPFRPADKAGEVSPPASPAPHHPQAVQAVSFYDPWKTHREYLP